jgi:translocation and assembly module TamA
MYFRYLFFILFLFTGLYAEGNVTAGEKVEETREEEIVLPSKEIHIEGLKVFDEADVLEALGAEHPSWFAFWNSTPPTIKEKLIPTIPAALQNYFDSEGYYDATYVVKDTDKSVTIVIDEGEPVRVNDVNISSDYDISQIVKFPKGEIFTADTFIRTKGKIVEALLKDGYCSYELDSKAFVDLDKHTVDVRFIVHKGGVCTFGNVTINGLKSIDPKIVKSRVRAEKGARFSTEAVQETSSAIYGLQSFDSVLINVDRKFYNVVPVDITVQEMKEPYHLSFGAGYDTYVGPRVHGKFTKHNFLGNAQQLSLLLGWSSLEQLVSLDFFKPVLFDLYGFDLDLGTSVGYSNLEFDGFREKKMWAKAFLKHETERFKLIGGVAFEVIDISRLDDGTPPLPDAAYDLFHLTYPYLDVSYDGRDSKLNPKYGYYFAGYIEYGYPTDPEASQYLKTQLEARGIYTVSELTMAVVGKIGSIDISGSSLHSIPESKKFFGGGAYSNRAYGFREIGVVLSPTEDALYGGESMANLSVEFDYPVWGDLYAAAFTDNTMISEGSYNFSGEIITSAGVGVRYMTPVGPFKFDVGFNVDDPNIYGISFQIGQSF